MNIAEILKVNQPNDYKKIKSILKKKKKEIKPKKTIRIENINIEELMSTRYYRRGRGGSLRQVR